MSSVRCRFLLVLLAELIFSYFTIRDSVAQVEVAVSTPAQELFLLGLAVRAPGTGAISIAAAGRVEECAFHRRTYRIRPDPPAGTPGGAFDLGTQYVFFSARGVAAVVDAAIRHGD